MINIQIAINFLEPVLMKRLILRWEKYVQENTEDNIKMRNCAIYCVVKKMKIFVVDLFDLCTTRFYSIEKEPFIHYFFTNEIDAKHPEITKSTIYCVVKKMDNSLKILVVDVLVVDLYKCSFGWNAATKQEMIRARKLSQLSWRRIGKCFSKFAII